MVYWKLVIFDGCCIRQSGKLLGSRSISCSISNRIPTCTYYTFHYEFLQEAYREPLFLLRIGTTLVPSIGSMISLLLKRAVFTTLTSASLVTVYYQTRKYTSPKNDMLPPYEANFQVPMHCDACVKDISGALSALPGTSSLHFPLTNPKTDLLILGILSTSFSLPTQVVSVKSSTPPSAIINRIQSTGRTAILRGTGAADSECPFYLSSVPVMPYAS